jgi:hypothetical protein
MQKYINVLILLGVFLFVSVKLPCFPIKKSPRSELTNLREWVGIHVASNKSVGQIKKSLRYNGFKNKTIDVKTHDASDCKIINQTAIAGSIISGRNLCKKTNQSSAIDWKEQSECALAKLCVSPEKIANVRTRMAWAMEPFISLKTNDIENKIRNCWKSLFEAVVHTDGAHDGKKGYPTYIQALKWTNMRINDVIGEVLGYVYPKFPIDESVHPGIYGPFDLEEGKEGARQMKEEGFYIMKKHLPKKYLKTIIEQTKTLHYHNHEKFNPSLRDGSVNFIKDQNEAVIKMPIVLDFMTDPTILYILQEYLGCAPVNTQTNTWWSVPGGGSVNQQTQKWHQDFTWIKFTKIFIYLNDVTRDNGAHRYVPGSFKDISPVLQQNPNYEVSKRVDNALVEKFYPGKARFMEGKAGTILLEDTRGLHAGTQLKKDYRQLLQWEFAVSSFRNTLDAWFPTQICKSDIPEESYKRILKYPRVYSRFELEINAINKERCLGSKRFRI